MQRRSAGREAVCRPVDPSRRVWLSARLGVSLWVRWGVALTVVSCTACGPGDAPVVVDDPPGPGAALLEPAYVDPGTSAELRALVEAQNHRDTERLLEGLRSSDSDVAARAAFALGSDQGRGAEAGLGVRLSDERPDVALASAFALGRLGTAPAAESLLGGLASAESSELRGEIIRSLGFTMGRSHIAPFVALDWPEEELGEAVMAVSRAGVRGQMTPEALSWLVGNLSHPTQGVRTAASYYFSRAPDAGEWRAVGDTVRAALAGLDSQDPAARFIIPGLAALGDTEDTPAFAHWSRASTDWRTRAVAVTALRDRLGDRTARDAAMAALRSDPSPHVVEAAAAELARSRPALQAVQEQVVTWLEGNGDRWQPAALLWSGLAPLGEGDRILAWLEDVSPHDALARAAAVEALSRVPGPVFLDRLFEEATGEDDRIAASAYRGLAGHFATYRDDEARLERFESTFMTGLGRRHPTIVGTAARGLTDPALLARGSAASLEAALLARDPSDPSDAAASAALVTALSQTRDTTWVGLLQRYLDHPQSQVRTAAREAVESLTLRTVEGRPRVGDGGDALDMEWASFPGARPEVLMETTQGAVRIRLAHEEAPLTVQTFLRLARSGAYDGVPFHRLVPSFVVQGGDVGRLDGTGGPGFTIRTELTRIPFERGVLGMASAGRDTEGSQFFVMHARAPHLDDRYTSFGWVMEGMDVVDRLLRGDRVLTMTVMDGPGG